MSARSYRVHVVEPAEFRRQLGQVHSQARHELLHRLNGTYLTFDPNDHFAWCCPECGAIRDGSRTVARPSGDAEHHLSFEMPLLCPCGAVWYLSEGMLHRQSEG